VDKNVTTHAQVHPPAGRSVLDLQVPSPLAIVPASLSTETYEQGPVPCDLALGRWVRLTLVLIALGLVLVFAVAIWLNPYRDGQVWLMETHRQLGLPECNFKRVTGLPCPSCGMTSSFALLMHGDLVNSLRANAAGTLLAILCLAYIPWALLCAARGRRLVIQSFERVLLRLVVVFLVLMLCRWVIVLLV
jgi:Protein of unknown function (DUF2752)